MLCLFTQVTGQILLHDEPGLEMSGQIALQCPSLSARENGLKPALRDDTLLPETGPYRRVACAQSNFSK